MGPLESKSRTASRSVQPFLHRSRHSVPVLYNGPPSLKIAPSHGGCRPHLIHGSLGPPESSIQAASRSLSRFCRTHYCDRPTDRPTDHATRSVTIGRIYVRWFAQTYIHWAICTTAGLLKLVITPQELLSCICVNVRIFSLVESRSLILRY